MQADVAKVETGQAGSPALGATVGGIQGDRRAARQVQALGQFLRHRHLGGAGVEEEGHRMAVDAPIQHIVALAIAEQAHLHVAVAMQRLRLHVGIVLLRLPLAEVARRQDDSGAPGEDQHDPAKALSWWLAAHLPPSQPPAGTAKRSTRGRESPSARAWSPLSRPIQAPLSSIARPSASPPYCES
ncbi:hypothetical protein D3C76_897860 [compost metagenome]